MPAGLTLAPNGILSGLPASAGLTSFEVQVTDAWGQTGQRAYTLVISNLPPPCLPAPSGLIGWWSGNGHVADFGGTNHAALMNGAGYATGLVSHAFSFDGADDFVQVGAGPDLRVTNNQLSLGAWVYPTADAAPGSYGTILNREGEYQLKRETNGTIWVCLKNTSPGWGWVNLGIAAPLGQWTHVAAVYDGSAVRGYQNGALTATLPASGALGDHYPTMNDFRIGGRQLAAQFFQGRIDEVMVFNRALAGVEVVALVQAGAAGLCRPLLPCEGPGGPFPVSVNASWSGLTPAEEFRPYTNDVAGAFCGHPTNYYHVGGTLPPGLTFASGWISGVVGAPGVYQFDVRAVDASGNQATAPMTLEVRLAPPLFTVEPVSQQVKLGDTLRLYAATLTPATFQWLFNNAEIAGGTNALLEVPTLSAAQAGAYRVRATGAGGVALSPEAQVRAEVPPAAIQGPTITTSSTKPRGNGTVMLQAQTRPGAQYTVFRATDLGSPNPFSSIATFVATDTESTIADTTASQHDAGFYRVAEMAQAPAAPFSLADATRLIGITEDGQTRPGLLPSQDTNTGYLGPMEFQLAGKELPEGYGLRVRFPFGALPQALSNGLVLVARNLELSFGPESPFQFADAPNGVVQIDSATDKQVPARSLTVADLEALMGRPANSGMDLVIYGRFRVTLLQGTFEGSSIRGPVLTWAGRQGDALRLPPRQGPVGGYADADIELTASRLRMAFYGEFRLEDGTPFAGVLRVAKPRPMWVELRPDGHLGVGGSAEAAFASGPRLNVDFLLDDPSYMLRVKASQLRVPGSASLAEVLPPLPALPDASGGAGAKAGKSSPDLTALAAQLDVADRAALAAAGLTAASDAQANPSAPPDFGNGSEELLALWAAIAKAAGGFDRLDAATRQHIARIVRRHALGDWASEDFLSLTAIAREVTALTIASKGQAEEASIGPALDGTLERLEVLFEDSACHRWDMPTLNTGAEQLLAAIRSAQNAQVITGERYDRLWNRARTVVRCRIDRLAHELGVVAGQFQPAPGGRIATVMKRQEALEYLRQALEVMEIGERAGFDLLTTETGNQTRLPEILAQLAFRVGQELTERMSRALAACDVRTYRHLMFEYLDVVRVCQAARNTRLSALCPPGIPADADLSGLILNMENTCDLNPLANQGEGSDALLADVRALTGLLGYIPFTVQIPSEAIQRQTAELGQRLDSLFARLADGEAFGANGLLALLEAGLLYDELRLRFELEGGTTWFEERMPDLARRLREQAQAESNPAALGKAGRILFRAEHRYTELALSGGGAGGGPAAKSRAKSASLTFDDRRLHVVTAMHGNSAALRTLAANGATVSADDPSAQADLWLPADITVEEVAGELHYDAQARRLSGAFNGRVSMPGVGRLDIRNASLNSGGAFDVSLSGSLVVPPNSAAPLARVSIPVDRPWHFQLAEDRQLTIEGGARLELPNGARLECWASMSDPVYRFGAVAQGLRLRAANALRGPVTGLTLGQLNDELHRDALELLAGVGGAMQPNDTNATFAADLESVAPFSRTALPSGDTTGAAAYRGLTLALRQPSIFSASAGGARPKDAQSDNTVSNLLELSVSAALRAGRKFADQAADLTPPAGGAATPEEAAMDYRRRLFEVARSLAEEGEELSALTNAARRVMDANLAGGNAALDLQTAAAGMLADYTVCLEDTLTGLLIAPAPGEPGPFWNDGTARNCRKAFLILQQAEQMLDVANPPSVAIESLLCGVTDVLVRRLLEGNGLNDATGLPDTTERRAIFDGLVHAYTRGVVTNLLEEWVIQEKMGNLCGATPFQTAAAAVLTHQRALVVAEFQALPNAVFTRAWEMPERQLELGRELFGILAALEALGFSEYPVSTPGFAIPAQAGTMEDDAQQVAAVVNAALDALQNLESDAGSGYPAVVAARRPTERGAALPDAGSFGTFYARFQSLPAVQTLRAKLTQLARAEATRLRDDVTAPDGAPLRRVRRDILTVFTRALDLLGLLDSPAPGGGGKAVVKANEDLIGDFGTVIFPALNQQLADNNDPWWTSAEAARLCLQQRERDGVLVSAARRQALEAGFGGSYEVTRVRVTDLSTRVGQLNAFADLPLPNQLDIVRLYGEFILNRTVPSFEARLGGRLELPQVPLVDGRPAFFDLERFLIATDGRIELIASAGAPLPFDGAWFTGAVTNKIRLWPEHARNFEFHGGGTLILSNGGTTNLISASLRYGPMDHDVNGNPQGWRFDIDGAVGALNQEFGDHFALFEASGGFSVGRDGGGNAFAALRTGGSAGLFRKAGREGIATPGAEDFYLIVRDVAAELGGTFPAIGAYAQITSGTLLLPAEYFSEAQMDPALRCSVAPGPNVHSGLGPRIIVAQPLRLSYAAGNGLPELDGVLQFRDISFHLPNIEQAQVNVCDARIGIGANGIPFIDVKEGRMKLPYPDALSDTDAVLKLENAHFGFDGLPTGTLSLAENWDLIDVGGFKVTLLKAGPPANPLYSPTNMNGQAVDLSGCPGTYFQVEAGSGPIPTFELGGAVQVTLPEVMLTTGQGGQVSGAVCGRLRIVPGPTLDSPPDVQLVVDVFRLAGAMKFGGGFSIPDASVVLGNLQYLARPSPEHAPYIELGGTLELGGFIAGLSGARAELRERGRPPELSIAALRFGYRAGEHLPTPLNLLPFALDFAEMRFKAPAAPLPERFSPTNVVLTVSGRIGVPTVENAFLAGSLSGLRFEFEEDGTPIPPPIDGFDLHMGTPPGLSIPGLGDLAGKIHIGGLQAAMQEPQQAASRIYMVGELGGTYQGYRVRQLWASLLAGPLGMCSDLNLANTGFVLTPTPFVITGARGGLAMMTTDNPCDFANYFTFDPVTGTYRLASGKDLPSVPGTPWPLFMSGLDMVRQKLAGLADHMPTPPLPNPPEANLAGGPRPKAGNEAVNFDCPSNCPPRTYTLLCQPHPTVPGRSIVKFTAIDEDTLNTLGITPGLFQNFAGSAQDAAVVLATAMVARVETLFPNPVAPGSGAPLPEGVGAFLADVRATALVGLSNMALLTVTNALGSNSATTFYTNLVALAGAGLPCLEATLMMEGRMSVVPVASFGWVAGRYVAGLGFGDVGLVGELNLLGIPVGEIRGFISPFDDQGLPNPSLCGQAHVAIGPLELGRVNVAAECRNCVTEPLRLFPALALALGDTLTRDFMGRIAPQLVTDAPNAAATVQRVLAIPDPQERARTMLAFVGSVLAAGPSVLPSNLGEVILNELRTAADNIQPRLVMCGRVQPKIFGLPLTLNGQPPVELLYSLTKSNYGLSFSISPHAFNIVFPPGDQFTFQEVLPVPDPVTMLLDSLSGVLNSPDTAAAYVRRQTDHALAHSVFSMEGRLQPLGLKLGVFGSRIILPDLTDHPVVRRGGWTPPEARTPALPSRDEVLVAAAVNGKLGLAASWIGTTNDFMTVFPEGDPRRTVVESARVELRHDYFPHGGVLGGGQLEMPRILTRFPSYWLSDLHHIKTNQNLLVQLSEAVQFVEDWLLTTDTNGTLAFYVPAPNPPMMYDANGEPLGKTQLNSMNLGALRPEDWLANIRSFDLSKARVGSFYPAQHAFLRGDLTNTAFLGIPLIDGLTIRGVPIPGSVPAGEPLATIEFMARKDRTWLGKLADRDVSVRLTVDSPPELSIEKFFTDLKHELESAQTALANAGGATPKNGPPPQLVNFFNSLGRGLPRFSHTNEFNVTLKDPRSWVMDSASSIPPALSAGLKLYIFSPQFATNAVGEGPVANAAREGGFAAAGSIDFLPSFPTLRFSADAELAVLPTASNPPLPRLMGQLRNVNLPDAFPPLQLIQNATADFDTGNARFLVVSNSFEPVNLLNGLFALQPVTGQRLGAEAAVEMAAGIGGVPVPRLSLTLDAARFSSPLFTSAGLTVHGYEGPGSRWSLRTDGEFNARVSFDTGAGLAARGAKSLDATCQWTLHTPLPGNPSFPVLCFKGLPDGAFKLEGASLHDFKLSFSADVQTLQVKLFPELGSIGPVANPWITLTPPGGNASLSFFLKSDGTYELTGAFQALEIAGQSFTSGSFTLANRQAIFHGQIAGGTAASLTLTLIENGTVDVQGGVTLIPAFCVANRVCLSGADGGGIGFSAGSGGLLCASGAKLTLTGLRPGGGDVQFDLPEICINLDGTLPPLSLMPTNLSVGPFKLDALNGLVLSGNLFANNLEVNTTNRLRLPPVLDADFQLHLGSDGVRLANVSPNQTLLGFNFDRVICVGSVEFANLDNLLLSFRGVMKTLPAPFNDLTLRGDIKPSGLFSLVRDTSFPSLDAASLFPLANVAPAFEYKPGNYADIVRSHRPSGYWRMEETIPLASAPAPAFFAPMHSALSGGLDGLYHPQVPINSGLLVPKPPFSRLPGPFETNSNRCVFFDGLDDYAEVAIPAANRPSFNSTEGFTVELWYQRFTNGHKQVIERLAGHRDRWALELKPVWVYGLPPYQPDVVVGTKLAFTAQGLETETGASPVVLASASAQMADTNWHHVAVVCDGSALYLYLDGRLDNWIATRGRPATTTGPITLAARTVVSGGISQASQHFQGSLDEVAYFNRALTPVEILDHHLAAGRGGVRLSGQFPFAGSPAPSFTGLVGRDGSRALQIDYGQPDPFGLASGLGIKFPNVRMTLLAASGQTIATLDGSLDWPQLFARQPKVKGFYTSTNGGELNVHATDLGTPNLPGFPEFRFSEFNLSRRSGVVRSDFRGTLGFPLNAGTVPFSGEFANNVFQLSNPAPATLSLGPGGFAGQFEFPQSAMLLRFGPGPDKSLTAAGMFRAGGFTASATNYWAADGVLAMGFAADTGWIQPSVTYSCLSGGKRTTCSKTFPGAARASGRVAFQLVGTTWEAGAQGDFQATFGELPPLNVGLGAKLNSDGTFTVDESFGGYGNFTFDLW